MKNNYDALVVGAGPAGLSSSLMLAESGLRVALLDEQTTPGGQVYRNILNTNNKRVKILGKNYVQGRQLVNAFLKSTVDYLPGSVVWQTDPDGSVFFSKNGKSRRLNARFVIIATGAMERPVPLPGWTLPGVMTCGGVLNLFKDAGVVPNIPLVIAGSGPLILLVAEHLLNLGAPVQAILDTTPKARYVSPEVLKHLPGALIRASYLMEGAMMMVTLRKLAFSQKVPVYQRVKNISVKGNGKVETVSADCRGKFLEFNVSTLILHEGVIPNTNLTRQVGFRHVWNDVQRVWHPDTDFYGRSLNLSTIFAAGDGNFVHGAGSAIIKGKLAALKIIKEFNRIDERKFQEKRRELEKNLATELAPRPFIDALYSPSNDLYHIHDDTIVCRCESITAGTIRKTVQKGLSDPNEIKSMIRCGMGPCQGRMCGPAVHEIVARESGNSVSEIRALRIRPPIKPVSMQEMAAAVMGEDDEK